MDIWAIMRDAAVHIHTQFLQGPLSSILSDIHLGVKLLGHSETLCLMF